jgi:3-deoxy-D-manno-octulosonic acid (KDO) 8-phosphate synthase
VFKASFDKANRSSIHSFRGPDCRRAWRYWLRSRRPLACQY